MQAPLKDHQSQQQEYLTEPTQAPRPRELKKTQLPESEKGCGHEASTQWLLQKGRGSCPGAA